MSRFDLIIFDCDGVLIDSEIISARMLIAELAQLGVTIDMPYVTRHFLGRSYPVVMQQIRQDFVLDLPPAFEAAYRERLLAAFEAYLRIMPGVAAVLAFGTAVLYRHVIQSGPGRTVAGVGRAGASGGAAPVHGWGRGTPQTRPRPVPARRHCLRGRPCRLPRDRRQPERHPRRPCGRNAGLALYRRQPSGGAGRWRA